MKKSLRILVLLFVVIGLVGCSYKKEEMNNKEESNSTENKKSLVLYFSATGTTEKVAKKIATVIDADIDEIIPKEKYTKEDLEYQNENCRANREQNDKSIRPEIENKINISDYNTIYIGYPIWWGTNPKIIFTLLDTYDFSSKKVVLFCTSGSSGIEQSMNDIKTNYSNLHVIDGKRFSASTEFEEINKWVNHLDN